MRARLGVLASDEVKEAFSDAMKANTNVAISFLTSKAAREVVARGGDVVDRLTIAEAKFREECKAAGERYDAVTKLMNEELARL